MTQFGLNAVGDYPNGYFDLTLDAGQSMALTIRIINSGEVNVDLRVYVANVTSPPNGGFGVEEEQETSIHPTTWIDLPGQEFELEAHDTRDIPFTVEVPEGTAPGQYISGLVARTSEAIPIPGTTTYDQIIQSAIAVLITVPGPVNPEFILGTPSFDIEFENRLLIPIENTGNILVRPTGKLVVATPDGQEVVSAPITMDSVYAGLTSSIVIGLPDQMLPGEYAVSLVLTDEATGARAEIETVGVNLPSRDEGVPAFAVDPVSIRPNGDPVQFADISMTINNAGAAIPTATVILRVLHNGEHVEDYVIAQNQAMPSGTSTISQRYIPATGWEAGTYSFEIVVSSVEGGVETVLATLPIEDTIVIP